MEHFIQTILPPIIGLLELMGIFVVTWSSIRAFWEYLQNAFRHKDYPLQVSLASGLATGLAFKMAAEILKTVLVQDLQELVVLGAVIFLRALMSFLIHFELRANGHKKQKAPQEQEEPVH